MPGGDTDPWEKVRKDHERLLERFRAWGAGPREVVGAHDFLDWLGPVPPGGPTERDVIEFLWGWVPRKYLAEEDALDEIRSGVVRLLEYMAHEDPDVGVALRMAGDREAFLRRIRTFEQDGPAWFEDLNRALEATGMEPFTELPDGFAWGGIQGPVEAEAFEGMRERLTAAVRRGEVEPDRPDWHRFSAQLQMAWLDAPNAAFGGRTPRAAVAEERADQEPHLAQIAEGMRTMQGEGLFRGLPLEGVGAPPPTGLEPRVRFPVLPIASREEVAAAVASAPLTGHLRALLELLGDGRPLTKKNNLTLADAKAFTESIGKADQFDPLFGRSSFRTRSSAEIPAVRLAFSWARAAGFVKVAHHRAEPTRRGRRLGDDPVEDWRRLFDAFVWKLGWPRRRWPQDRVPFWADDLCDLVPRLLEALYQEGGEPMPLTELSDAVWHGVRSTYDLSWMTEEQERVWPGMLANDMWQGVFVPLAELGAVELSGERALAELLAAPQGEDVRAVRSTPLGLWAIRGVIEDRWGRVPPATGDLAATVGSAEALIAIGAELDLWPGELAEEARRYREIHGPGAAEELAARLARGGPDVLAVHACLDALDPHEVGPVIQAAARTASGGGALQCVAWLQEHGFEAPEVEVSQGALAEATVWSLVAVARGDGPEGVGESLAALAEEEQVEAVGAIGRLDSPFAIEALEAVAMGSPSPTVRKAARKALHRQRTRNRVDPGSAG